MIAVIKGKDRHTVRLTDGLKSLGKSVEVILHPKDLKGKRFNLAFVDPSFNYDISNNLNADKIIFFDTEDAVTDFTPGVAYETLKCTHYAKMNFIENDRGDGIKNVGFPLAHSIRLREVAEAKLNFKPTFRPFFIGTPTYLGSVKPNSSVSSRIYPQLDIKCLADNGVYNQRYDWLGSLRKQKIPSDTGIVFSHGNYSLEVQTQWHGKGIQALACKSIPYQQQLLAMMKSGLSLCPTGHERLSWRTFDIMATGSIMFITDFEHKKFMHMPVEYIKVKDGEDLSDVLKSFEKDLPEMYKAARKNREVIASLTPDKVWKDFLNSIEYNEKFN